MAALDSIHSRGHFWNHCGCPGYRFEAGVSGKARACMVLGVLCSVPVCDAACSEGVTWFVPVAGTWHAV